MFNYTHMDNYLILYNDSDKLTYTYITLWRQSKFVRTYTKIFECNEWYWGVSWEHGYLCRVIRALLTCGRYVCNSTVIDIDVFMRTSFFKCKILNWYNMFKQKKRALFVDNCLDCINDVECLLYPWSDEWWSWFGWISKCSWSSISYLIQSFSVDLFRVGVMILGGKKTEREKG